MAIKIKINTVYKKNTALGSSSIPKVVHHEVQQLKVQFCIVKKQRCRTVQQSHSIQKSVMVHFKSAFSFVRKTKYRYVEMFFNKAAVFGCAMLNKRYPTLNALTKPSCLISKFCLFSHNRLTYSVVFLSLSTF